jgi:hypothetical protein
MSREKPTLGIDGGEFVPLTVEEFRRGYATFDAGMKGELPPDPDFPTEYRDAVTGNASPVPDTPFNRAWIAAGKTFTDAAKRISFYKRVEIVMALIKDRKYSKYVGYGSNSLHIALLSAIATVPFSIRTTKKALRVAFDTEFRRYLAASVDPGEPGKPQ